MFCDETWLLLVSLKVEVERLLFMYPYDVQGKGQWDLYFGNREKDGNYSILVEYIFWFCRIEAVGTGIVGTILVV